MSRQPVCRLLRSAAPGAYLGKARWNDRQARWWVLVSIVLEIAGLIGGALKAFG